MMYLGSGAKLKVLPILNTLTKLHSESMMGKFVRFPLRFLSPAHVMTVRGGINRGAKWTIGASTHGCWLGTYEHEKQSIVADVVKPGMTVWDIGANAGFYTLAFSRLVGESGRVYAFEPLAENACNLVKHVFLNHLNNVKVVQAALAGKTGIEHFRMAESNSMGHIAKDDTPYLVPVVTVDEFIKCFPESRPQVLKIDVEGAESTVLAGAKSLLSGCAPEIILALHGEHQKRECQEILASHGYTLYYLDHSQAGQTLDSDEIYARKSKDVQAGSVP